MKTVEKAIRVLAEQYGKNEAAKYAAELRRKFNGPEDAPVYSIPKFINEDPMPMDHTQDALRYSLVPKPAPNGHVKRRRSKASREAQAKKMRAYWKKRKAGK